MIVVLAGQKGGAGKTTLALNVACELAARGRDVTLLEADGQRSALTFDSVAETHGRRVIKVITSNGNVYEELRQLARNADDIVVDTPGRLGDVQRAAMMGSDVVLFPVVPSPLDGWALADTLSLFVQAREARPELRGAIVINMRDGRSVDGQEARADLVADDAVKVARVAVLKTKIGNRTAFRRSLREGRGVASTPRAQAAREEIASLVRELHRITRRSA
jgi:chromosome partitioning protein